MTKLVRKLWVGIGVVSMAGICAEAAPALAQHGRHDAAPADSGNAATPARIGEGGEAYPADGGPADTRIRVLRDLALIRGHLLVGNELVGEGRWDEALPHFLHPTEEIYGKLERYIKLHGVAPFDGQLKALAQTVKAQRGGAYSQASRVVDERLTGASIVFRKYMNPLPRMTIKAAVEVLKVAASEYASSIEDGRFSKPVEYQDSRGFILYAEQMIAGVAGDLHRHDATALTDVRNQLAALKRAWPGPMPPAAPVLDVAAVAAIVTAIEVASTRF